MHPEHNPRSPEDIDRFICAEIPDSVSNPKLFGLVSKFMVHGPCGVYNRNSPCMRNGKCTKHYPKCFRHRTIIDDEGFPRYRRIDNGRVIQKKKCLIDNTFIVPYNSKLLLKFGCHINVEYTCQTSSIKYLFKYVHKGNDRVTASLLNHDSVDEIQSYYDCRYISACEATWRLFTFDIQVKYPPVIRLPFHLNDQQSVVFRDNEDVENVLERAEIKTTMFQGWMQANKEYTDARGLTYTELPTKFVWNKKYLKWVPRQQGFAIGRVSHVPTGNGEDYYLRLLLNIQKGCMSFKDIRTVNGFIYPTFKDACYALGLLQDDKEFIDAIKESFTWASGHYIRKLFTIMLISNNISRPEYVWESCWQELSDSILYNQRQLLQMEGECLLLLLNNFIYDFVNHSYFITFNIVDLQLSEEEIKNICLGEIEEMMQGNGRSLRDYPPIPLPSADTVQNLSSRLVAEELNFDRGVLTDFLGNSLQKLTDEQKTAFNKIMQAVEGDNGGFFFLYGYGGTGKTFVWNTLSAAVRCKGQICLNVASSGIASLLLPNGRTAHSRFKIPLNINEDSCCNIKQGSPHAKLIQKAKLIIWDEAPMVSKLCFEALDRCFRDILRFCDNYKPDLPFGGKVVVLGGDFRQILPVIPRGSRQDIANSVINSSYLWSFCEVLTLTKNMRLNDQSSKCTTAELKSFSEWLLKVGDGLAGDTTDGEAEIQIPEQMLIKNSENGLDDLIDFVYPDMLSNMNSPGFFKERSILAPTLDVVSQVNNHIMDIITGEERTYLSSDSVCREEGNSQCELETFSPEVLNGLNCSGLPPHKLVLKVGVPIMLLRNIDQSNGLCNGTRMQIRRLGNHVIECEILTGNRAGGIALIPRMNMIPNNQTLPVKFQRRQFPIVVSFAMTINKSQGQTLSCVGLFLPRPVFTHGQLYVALSRVKSIHGLKILLKNHDNVSENCTINVVYREVFQKLS